MIEFVFVHASAHALRIIIDGIIYPYMKLHCEVVHTENCAIQGSKKASEARIQNKIDFYSSLVHLSIGTKSRQNTSGQGQSKNFISFRP